MFDFSVCSLSTITTAYNAFVASRNPDGYKPVKAFRTKPLAVERLEKLVTELHLEPVVESDQLVLDGAQPVEDSTIDPREDAEDALPVAPRPLPDEEDEKLAELENADAEEAIVEKEAATDLTELNAFFPSASAPASAPAPKARRGQKAEKAPARQRSEYLESQVITVIGAFTARVGSNRAARYGTLRSGMTVGEYLDAAYAANGMRRSRHRYHSDIRLLVGKGVITVA